MPTALLTTFRTSASTQRPHRMPALAATLVLCGTLAAVAATAVAQTQGPAQDVARSAAATPVAVQVARLDSVWIQPEREAQATVVARNQARIAAEVAGRVLDWQADVGAQVSRGAVLARIDPRDLELAVQRAQAALDAAQAREALAQVQQRRARDLVAQNFLSQEALAQRETELNLAAAETRAAQAQLLTARHQLDKAVLRAPFAATVLQRMAQTGEAVAPGAVLFVLAERGAVEVQAMVNPADVAGLRGAQNPVFDALDATRPVRLARVSDTLTDPARQQLVRLTFARESAPIGASGTLRWRDARPHLPAALMVRRGQALGVFVVQGDAGQTRARFVALPGAQEGRASLAALAGDTRIVVQGQLVLQDGVAVTATPAHGAAAGAAR